MVRRKNIRSTNDQTEKYRINYRIKSRQVRVITEDGEQLGIFMRDDAIKLAQERSLDLVEVSSKSSPPVCKLIDYGKLKYNQKKKIQESKKKQAKVVLKEIKLRPKTGEHDIEIKLTRASNFLSEGAKVKFTMMFRGREIVYSANALQTLLNIAQKLEEADLGAMEVHPKLEGRNMTMMFAPKK